MSGSHITENVRDFFPPSCGAVSDEHGERFHQDISAMEQRYQGHWNEAILMDYCWSVCRNAPEFTFGKPKENDLMKPPHDSLHTEPPARQTWQRHVTMEVPKGKIATVTTDFESKHYIFVKSVMKNALTDHEVIVYHCPELNEIKLAFCFEFETEQLFFVVEEDDIKLLNKKENTNLPDERCLFMWDKKTGEWGYLRSVAEPGKYLCLEKDKVTVGQNPVKFRLNELESK
ncbi:uncharacterized protein LOC105007229 isoform X2 [Esox lucius]|uniref:uncharacterized protein LOC105007229 isoform X2 n=1 Tax=Esox lucius TaxID=8010 RepID=UPI0010BE06D4|nr:uncharacterized protein LOC105007229 isoform X2 [Esox lucius]